MNCPNCLNSMNNIQVTSRYGNSLFLDQCPHCGGLWFDSMEMYMVKNDVSDLIDKVDASKLVADTTIKERMLCPKDGIELAVFSDVNFPSSIKVESCKQCGGFFFNRGEFHEFSDEREKILARNSQPADEKLAAQIEGLLRLDSSAAAYNSIGNLGKFLSKKYYTTDGKNVVALDNGSEKLPAGYEQAEGIALAAANIIPVLFQLFLKSKLNIR